MCRMIGVAARMPVRVAPYLEALARQAQSGRESPHADGYGLALLCHGHWLHIREQSPLWQGALAPIGQLEASLMLLHARKASDPTTINLTKLHPFCWPACDGAPGLMFCQNGTIRRHDRLATRLADSAIDTEKYFDLVIGHYERTPGAGLLSAQLRAADDVHAAQADPTSLNALLSDGRRLVAYKGRILPENRGYHTLFLAKGADVAVASTECFDLPWSPDWQELEGAAWVTPR